MGKKPTVREKSDRPRSNADAARPRNRSRRHIISSRSAKPGQPVPIPLDPDAAVYITRAQLRQIVPACDMTIWRWIRNPAIAFPPPVQLGSNLGRNYWWLPAIRDWMRRRETQQQPVPVRRGVVRRNRTPPRRDWNADGAAS
jgi:predicted DNA-binding transcriptional regulator AlpA